MINRLSRSDGNSTPGSRSRPAHSWWFSHLIYSRNVRRLSSSTAVWRWGAVLGQRRSRCPRPGRCGHGRGRPWARRSPPAPWGSSLGDGRSRQASSLVEGAALSRYLAGHLELSCVRHDVHTARSMHWLYRARFDGPAVPCSTRLETSAPSARLQDALQRTRRTASRRPGWNRSWPGTTTCPPWIGP